MIPHQYRVSSSGFVTVTVFTTPKSRSYVPVASAKTPGTSMRIILGSNSISYSGALKILH